MNYVNVSQRVYSHHIPIIFPSYSHHIHPFLDGIFPYKPTIFDTSIDGIIPLHNIGIPQRPESSHGAPGESFARLATEADGEIRDFKRESMDVNGKRMSKDIRGQFAR